MENSRKYTKYTINYENYDPSWDLPSSQLDFVGVLDNANLKFVGSNAETTHLGTKKSLNGALGTSRNFC
jgi:hypothetical protein